MDLIFSVIADLLAGILRPLNSVSPAAALACISILSGMLMARAFAAVSDQSSIRRGKDRMWAQLLAVVLYRDNPCVLLRAPGRLLLANLVYFRHALPPFMLLALLCIPILAPLNNLYGHRPLEVGEACRVAVFFEDSQALSRVVLNADEGFDVVTDVLRIEQRLEANWKIVATRPGRHRLSLSVDAETVEKEIVVADGVIALATQRSKSLLGSILYPGEKRLDKKSLVNRIQVNYPQRQYMMFGTKFNWLMLFLVMSLVGAYAGKRIFRVEV